MNHELNNTLKLHRARMNLTQAELADLVGVSRRSINSIERGHFVPSTVLALRLADVFEIRVEDLFSLAK
jgi:putative transcriptional regulator